MELFYRLEENDYLSAHSILRQINPELARKHGYTRLLGGTLILMAVAFTLDLPEKSGVGLILTILIAVVLAAIGLVYLNPDKIISWRFQQQARNDDSLVSVEVREVPSEKGLHVFTPLGDFVVEWSRFTTWNGDLEGVLLVISGDKFHFIPNRAFSNPADRQQFSELVGRKLEYRSAQA